MFQAGVLEACGSESDSSRLARLFDAHHDRLYRLARRLAGSRDEAQDLVQEAFVRAAGSLTAMPQGAQHEEAWLVRVLVNLCRDRWRRRKVRGRVEDDAVDAGGSSPETAYLARLAVQRALARLAPRRRAIVGLRELEGADVGTIARLLGISAVTVRWHLSRARAELAQLLDSHGPSPSRPAKDTYDREG